MSDTQPSETESASADKQSKRLTQLEEEVNQLTAQIQESETSGVNATRRQTLAGLIGGGALLSAAGSASAQSGSGDGGSNAPFAHEDHDHSGEFGTPNQLGRASPVELINVEDVQADSLSGVTILQDELDEAEVRELIAESSTPSAFIVEPGASWTLSDTLHVPDFTTIQAWSSRYYGEDIDTFKKGFDGTLAIVGRHVNLIGVSFNGQKDEYDGDGVHVIDERENRFVRTTIRQNAGDALVLDNVYMSYFHRCYWLRNDGWGLRFRRDLADPRGAHHISQNTFQRCEIGYNGQGGVKYELRDEVSVFDNVSVYSNEGPGYEFDEREKPRASLGNSIRAGYIIWNDGPAIVVRGGDWSITVEDSILNANAGDPSDDLTEPVGAFHIEDGRADISVRNSINGEGGYLYTAWNDEEQNFDVSGAAMGNHPGGLAGDIVGPNTRFTCQNLANLTGDVDVQTGIALNPLNGGSVEHYGEPDDEEEERITYDTSAIFVEASTEVNDSFDEAIQLEATEEGEWWTFEFEVDEADEYQLEIETLWSSSYGIYELYINDEHIDTVDFYNDAIYRDTVTYTVGLEEGTNVMRWENVGHHDDSSAYKMGLYYLHLVR